MIITTKNLNRNYYGRDRRFNMVEMGQNNFDKHESQRGKFTVR
jgi:hypothetical protein